MLRPADRHRSLEDIDGEQWGDAPKDSTYLVTTVHQLRRKPLDKQTVH